MPFNIIAERSIIVGMLHSEGLRRTALLTLTPEHFKGANFRILFEAVGDCESRKLIPDAATILQITDGQDFGGLEFFNVLLAQTTPENFDFHLSQVKEDLNRRTAAIALPKILERVEDKTQDRQQIYNDLKVICKMMEQDGKENEVSFAKKYCAHFDERCSSLNNFQGTGITTLDEILTEGFSRETTSIIAARTGNGKTTSMVDIVKRRLKMPSTPKIAVFPLEIGQVRFLDKLISNITGIQTIKMRKLANELTLKDRDKIKETVHWLQDLEKLMVFDNPFVRLEKWTNETALDKLESMVAIHEPDIIFMDLFQRMLIDIRPQSIELALGRIQNMAKEYRTHFCMLHQISRRSEERKDKRPEMEDLKGSGGFEEFPDLILLLHRPKAHKQFRMKDEIEITPVKQRDGQARLTVVADFIPDISRLDCDRFAADKTTEDEDPY